MCDIIDKPCLFRVSFSNTQAYEPHHIVRERSTGMKKWRCKICGYVHEGDTPPEECPICGASKDQFEEVTD
jgi:rubrerythrin